MAVKKENKMLGKELNNLKETNASLESSNKKFEKKYAILVTRYKELADKLNIVEADKRKFENPATQTAFTLLQEQLRTVLNTLPPREQEVLKMRFGLEDGYSLTLEEVGLYFDVTRERIRQIEAKALRRLRHPGRQLRRKRAV